MLYNGDYDNGQLGDLGATIDLAFEYLSHEWHRSKFDAIVVRGISGLLVGPAVAVRLGVPLVVVRKPGDASHSTGDNPPPERPATVHGIDRRASLRVLFLDDFISSGATYRAAKEAVERESEYRVVASYSYRDNKLVDRTDISDDLGRSVEAPPTAVSFA